MAFFADKWPGLQPSLFPDTTPRPLAWAR